MNTPQDFDLRACLGDLKHYLPAQAPLKDFIHHNTLHAFQNKRFHDALSNANEIFGYSVYLTYNEYISLHLLGKISDAILEKVLSDVKINSTKLTKHELLTSNNSEYDLPKIGRLRSFWKSAYKIDLDSMVHSSLFRLLGSYLDQGIALWNFPGKNEGFISSIRDLENTSLSSFFHSKRVKELLQRDQLTAITLLEILVGDPKLYEQYIFDQQFAHPGWSGMVAVVESNENALLDSRKISLEELIIVEMLMEIDAIDNQLGHDWRPLVSRLDKFPQPLFSTSQVSHKNQMLKIWHEAYEWTYYDEVLSAIKNVKPELSKKENKSFQAIFCIDDRECSLRRYIEEKDSNCETFGTAGFFNVAFYYQPENGKFHTKVCPAPVTPKHLIKEIENTQHKGKDFHFGKHTHGLLSGWIYTHTLGFWSALKLFFSVFKPNENEASVSSFRHMDKHSLLTIEHKDGEMENGLQVGFTIPEMTDCVEGLLRSIGLIDAFAPLIYVVGHGSSSVNNTHYAGYDCGACSGRPGSVNARVISHFGNHPEVRAELSKRGINIPKETQFVGALHDTSRDEMMYFDLKVLTDFNFQNHHEIKLKFDAALDHNARERSRRFISLNSKQQVAKVHQKVKLRTVSLFEPRPELNHATNALCIVGRRDFSKQIFLDRRSFLNSYDCTTDPNGTYLLGILNAVAPVCGGINLEYFFSRMDNQQLGAGTKLPHNVMGLIAVANGIDGDLRTGLPSQMVEVHDPVRLMVIVEHYPEVVLETIQKNPSTYNWFLNEWIHLCAVDPDTRQTFMFENGAFTEYIALSNTPDSVDNIEERIISSHENLPVYLLKNKSYGVVN